ncbi:hypothetical protein K8R43_00635 [archaeon]|nr:hypothetical protein [archaeon]
MKIISLVLSISIAVLLIGCISEEPQKTEPQPMSGIDVPPSGSVWCKEGTKWSWESKFQTIASSINDAEITGLVQHDGKEMCHASGSIVTTLKTTFTTDVDAYFLEDGKEVCFEFKDTKTGKDTSYACYLEGDSSDGTDWCIPGTTWSNTPIGFDTDVWTVHGLADYNGEEMCHLSIEASRGNTDTYYSQNNEKTCVIMTDKEDKILLEMCADSEGNPV